MKIKDNKLVLKKKKTKVNEYNYNEDILHLELSKNVKVISRMTFSGCRNLQTVILNENIEEIVSLLKGGGREVIRHYKTLMQEAAMNMEFEQAQVYKEKMQSLESHYSKSVIVNTSTNDVDVFSLVMDGPEAFGNFLRIKGGAVVQSLNLGFRLMIEEPQESVLATFVAEIQSKFGDLSREVVVPFLPDMEIDGVEFRVPVRGDKLALLELSARNAKEMLLNAAKKGDKQ